MGGNRGVAVVVAGLVLAVGGCGEGGTDDQAAPSSAEPKPTRSPSSSASPPSELVEWVGDMCESTVALRNLREESAADLKEIRDSDDETGMLAHARALGYLSRTPADVETGPARYKYYMYDLGPGDQFVSTSKSGVRDAFRPVVRR
ncbi:hypothetical protein ABZ192_00285 [Streptomyces sp. NPDC006235]|uniref:hypothetical protein n=1 Tax=Streptomyces sp. NPDC006235 TaxID=3156736 RepID=UPI0033B93F54